MKQLKCYGIANFQLYHSVTSQNEFMMIIYVDIRAQITIQLQLHFLYMQYASFTVSE